MTVTILYFTLSNSSGKSQRRFQPGLELLTGAGSRPRTSAAAPPPQNGHLGRRELSEAGYATSAPAECWEAQPLPSRLPPSPLRRAAVSGQALSAPPAARP